MLVYSNDRSVAVRLVRKTMCAVVHLSERGRERRKETRNHSAGTFASTVADVCINLERNASIGLFFLNLDSGKGRKQNNMRREKNKVARILTLLSDTCGSKLTRWLSY